MVEPWGGGGVDGAGAKGGEGGGGGREGEGGGGGDMLDGSTDASNFAQSETPLQWMLQFA